MKLKKPKVSIFWMQNRTNGGGTNRHFVPLADYNRLKTQLSDARADIQSLCSTLKKDYE